ncbi:acyloxyacyl hydrolase [bacterium]|nr:acyloxyacyl hydrolase [bacterium]
MHRVLCLSIIAFFVCICPTHADPLRFDSMTRGQREISLLMGYGENHKIPEATKDRFSFDTIKLRYGVFTSPRTQLAVNLGYGNMEGDDDNSALWTTGSYRRYFLVRGQTALAYDFNIGILHFGDHISEQGTRTNFTEQLGLVLQHSTETSSAYTIEYVFSHTSNAGIKLPNLGVNASIVALGYSWFR